MLRCILIFTIHQTVILNGCRIVMKGFCKMAFIRWSTKLPNKRFSNIYSWWDTDGGVYICSNEKSHEKCKNVTGTFFGGSQVRLTRVEMEYLCKSYLDQMAEIEKNKRR